jgi:hypothetical protein
VLSTNSEELLFLKSVINCRLAKNLCCSPPFQNGLHVVPVIGMVSDKALFQPVLNKAEVEDIFDAPLEMFLKVLLFSLLSILM